MGGEHDVASSDDVVRHSLGPDSGLNTEFTLPDLFWVLQRLETRLRPASSAPLILIGGQALNYWCDYYRVDNPDLDQHGPFASKDIDFQAPRDLIPWCSKQVGGEYSLTEGGDKSSLMNGVVNVPIADAKTLRLDFMQCAYGLGADEVVKSAVTVHVTADPFTFDIAVMHPLHCMKSRVKNVMGLPDQYANEHGIRQLRASIICLRMFIEDTAADDERRGLTLNNKAFEFARDDLDADRLYRSRKIDVFDAVSNAPCVCEKFPTMRYPQMVDELARKRQ
jgi:hypothetical protein